MVRFWKNYLSRSRKCLVIDFLCFSWRLICMCCKPYTGHDIRAFQGYAVKRIWCRKCSCYIILLRIHSYAIYVRCVNYSSYRKRNLHQSITLCGIWYVPVKSLIWQGRVYSAGKVLTRKDIGYHIFYQLPRVYPADILISVKDTQRIVRIQVIIKNIFPRSIFKVKVSNQVIIKKNCQFLFFLEIERNIAFGAYSER